MFSQYRTLQGWEVPIQASSFAPTGDNRWTNRDMDPVPLEEQNWSAFNYITYWISDTYGSNGLALAGTMVAAGLSWWQAVLAVFTGNMIVAWACTAQGTTGARLHTPFSVTVRGSFGFWFSYVAVIFRLVIGTVWYGVNCYTGALGTYACLRAIWPSFTTFENHLPASASITSKMMISFFVFWVIQTSLSMISPSRLRWLFFAKMIIGPAAGLTLLGYYVHKSGGALYGGSNTLHGSTLTWAWLGFVNSAASYSTLAVNIGDFTRYARSPRSQYVQLLVLPLCSAFTALMGVFIASGSHAVYGGAIIWNPITLLDKWNNRAAIFFVGAAFAYCQICTNISSNGLSAANDWCVLFPKYLNLRRGAFLTSILGSWPMLPWKVLASAKAYVNFLSANVVFMGPIAGIMIADYWFVKRQRVDIAALYDPHGRYRYRWGGNWRALATLALSIFPNFGGFLHAVGGINVAPGAVHFYALSLEWSLVSSMLIYTLISKLFPPRGVLIKDTIDEIPENSTPTLEDVDEKSAGQTEVDVVPAI